MYLAYQHQCGCFGSSSDWLQPFGHLTGSKCFRPSCGDSWTCWKASENALCCLFMFIWALRRVSVRKIVRKQIIGCRQRRIITHPFNNRSEMNHTRGTSTNRSTFVEIGSATCWLIVVFLSTGPLGTGHHPLDHLRISLEISTIIC